MKAPDKIYLLRNKIGVILNSWFLDSDNQLENIEYIRKDALLEWLEKKVPLSYGLATDAFVEIIDKLNSL